MCYLRRLSNVYLKHSHRWQELKVIFDKQNGKCPYTGRTLTIGVDAEIDHIIPRAKGGSNEPDNLQWVYEKINRMKFDYSHTEFLNMIKEVYCFTIESINLLHSG
jgi:5-methylcytosine-specific restriction endonuclease McrA